MKWKGISFNFSLNQIIHHLDCDCFVSCMFSLFRHKFSFAFYQCNNQQINPTHSSSFHFCPIFSLHSFDEWNILDETWIEQKCNNNSCLKSSKRFSEWIFKTRKIIQTIKTNRTQFLSDFFFSRFDVGLLCAARN